MPLSEHEQRILHELEQSLYQEDPDFAERVRSETVYRHAGRYCIWSALVFVAALVFMFFTFSTLGGTRIRRRRGDVPVRAWSSPTTPGVWARPGIDDISRSLHSRNISNTVHDPRDWIRGRFHRDD